MKYPSLNVKYNYKMGADFVVNDYYLEKKEKFYPYE